MSDKSPSLERLTQALHLPHFENGNCLTLSNGTEVRLRYFSPRFFLELIRDAARRWPDPIPPVITVDGFDGKREESNPHDPEYKRLTMEALNKRSNFVTDAMLLFGVETGIPDSWKRQAEYLELGLPDNPDALHIYYLRNFVLVDESDYRRVIGALKQRSTVTEEGVAEASARFQREGNGTADHGLPPAPLGDHGGDGVGAG